MIAAIALVLAALPLAGAGDIVALIVRESSRVGIDSNLALAVAWHESRLRPGGELKEPKLKTSSIGVFQVLLPTARSMGFAGTKAQLFDPKTNIKYGIQYLSGCVNRFGADVDKVLCCYNGGHRVRESFCQTPRIRHYIAQVKPWYNMLQKKPATREKMAQVARGEWVRIN